MEILSVVVGGLTATLLVASAFWWRTHGRAENIKAQLDTLGAEARRNTAVLEACLTEAEAERDRLIERFRPIIDVETERASASRTNSRPEEPLSGGGPTGASPTRPAAQDFEAELAADRALADDRIAQAYATAQKAIAWHIHFERIIGDRYLTHRASIGWTYRGRVVQNSPQLSHSRPCGH